MAKRTMIWKMTWKTSNVLAVLASVMIVGACGAEARRPATSP